MSLLQTIKKTDGQIHGPAGMIRLSAGPRSGLASRAYYRVRNRKIKEKSVNFYLFFTPGVVRMGKNAVRRP